MSKYYVNKFLFTTDRDPELLHEYATRPAAYLKRWEREIGPRLNDAETTSWLGFTDDERRALVEHDYVALFEMGAHFFLSLTIYIGIYNDEYEEKYGPLSFQREFRDKLSHWLGREYPAVNC